MIDYSREFELKCFAWHKNMWKYIKQMIETGYYYRHINQNIFAVGEIITILRKTFIRNHRNEILLALGGKCIL